MGRTIVDPSAQRNAPFIVAEKGIASEDGFASDDGLVVGTYVHGLLENAPLRRAMLRRLAVRKQVVAPDFGVEPSVEVAIDRLADDVRTHLDMSAIFAMAGLEHRA